MHNPLVVTVIGTGIMGSRMAARLVAAGHRVRTWNRTWSKAQAIEGAQHVPELSRAVDGADVVITMLSDGPTIRSLMSGREGALKSMKERAVWLQMATIGTRQTEELARMAADVGVRFLDAPVIGSRQPAEVGSLIVLVGGANDALEAARPVIEAVSRKALPVGAVGRASALKLVFNSWLVSVVGSLAETLALAQSLDIGPQEFFDTIHGGALDLPYAHVKGAHMAARDYPTSFPLRLALKDALLAQELALDAGLEPAILDAVAMRLARAVEAGHAESDMAAVFETSGARG